MLLEIMLFFAQTEVVTTTAVSQKDWFDRIIDAGSFGLVAAIFVFLGYWILRELPKIIQASRDEKELDRQSRHQTSQAFQVATAENVKYFLEALKEQRDVYRAELKEMRATYQIWFEKMDGRFEKEVDKILIAQKEDLQELCEQIATMFEAAIAKMRDEK